MTDKKTCQNCAKGCYPPASVKPRYSAGGMMLMCCNPRKLRRNGILMVAPDYKCLDWISQPTEAEAALEGGKDE